MKNRELDIAIIGGGPAGITAGMELSRAGNLKVAIFEKEAVLGGMPRSCHVFFGIRDMKRMYSGQRYAEKLSKAIQKSSVEINTETTVMDISFANGEDLHAIEVICPKGAFTYKARFLLFATGCFERSRQNRRIPGDRPSGIFTTGSVQQLVNLMSCKPGKRALIIGSEIVALSCMLTLKKAKMNIVGLIEERPFLDTSELLCRSAGLYCGVPIWKNTSDIQILGHDRVEKVKFKTNKNNKSQIIKCDTVIVTGKFRPDSALIDNSKVEIDPATLGPYVDNKLETTVKNVFAAGNVLRGANTHDLCALEGKLAAQSILKRANDRRSHAKVTTDRVLLRVEHPIRYVVPQRIVPNQAGAQSWWSPGYSIQLDHTLVKPTLEAWCGDQLIWHSSFRKLFGRHRYNLPTNKFNWDRIDRKEIVIKVG